MYVSASEVEKQTDKLLKNMHFHHDFRQKKCINRCEWNMNKPLGKNLQNIERNKTLSFSVCQCFWSKETNSLPLNIGIFTMFLEIKCCINQCEWYMNKSHNKNLQNIESNKTLSFGVCQCCWSGETYTVIDILLLIYWDIRSLSDLKLSLQLKTSIYLRLNSRNDSFWTVLCCHTEEH